MGEEGINGTPFPRKPNDRPEWESPKLNGVQSTRPVQLPPDYLGISGFAHDDDAMLLLVLWRAIKQLTFSAAQRREDCRWSASEKSLRNSGHGTRCLCTASYEGVWWAIDFMKIDHHTPVAPFPRNERTKWNGYCGLTSVTHGEPQNEQNKSGPLELSRQLKTQVTTSRKVRTVGVLWGYGATTCKWNIIRGILPFNPVCSLN